MKTMSLALMEEDVFRRHNAGIQNSQWRASKEKAWDSFNTLPLPLRKDERWRFSNTKAIDLELYSLPEPMATEEAELAVQRSDTVQTYAARSVIGNNQILSRDILPQDLIDQGLVFCSLEEAWENHPELLEEHFEAMQTQLGSEKLQALHQAYASAGNFIYVPKNLVLDKPLVSYFWSAGEGSTIFPTTLLFAEENSRVDIVDIYASLEEGGPAFSSSLAYVYAKDGAKVFRKMAQLFNEETQSFQIEKNRALRDSEIKTVAINLGAKQARLENQVDIQGKGANVKIGSLTVGGTGQEFDQRTLQVHAEPNAVSDLLYKNALFGTAKTIFSGLIRVNPAAQQTDAYQTNRNLLLSDRAEAISLPGLEIEANDVKCSHGATTSQLDNRELFYMQSRGIPKSKAEELLVFGFFEEVIDYFDNEELAESLRKLIQEKITRL